ncbi:MAG: zinc-ribbon domain containing protein [Minicystis sp.]
MEQHRDEHLTCADCGAPFLFSASEAAVFAERGLASPKRCKDCRRARKERSQQQQQGGFEGGGGYARPRQDQGGSQRFQGGPPRPPQGRPEGGYAPSYGNARAPRYTGDVNEYRSPMADNGYAASPAPWGSDNGYAPRAPRRPAPPAGPRPAPRFQGSPAPAWGGEGHYRSPAQGQRPDGGGFDRGGPPAYDRGGQGFDRGPAPSFDRGAPSAQARRRPQAEMFSITCNSCGIQAEVPFRPAEGRDVFCQACYRARKPV